MPSNAGHWGVRRFTTAADYHSVETYALAGALLRAHAVMLPVDDLGVGKAADAGSPPGTALGSRGALLSRWITARFSERS